MEFMELVKTAKVDNVVLWRPHSHKKTTGTLCLTSHHILFSDRSSHEDELMLLYMAVEHLDRKFSGTAGILTLLCKDFTSLKMKIPGQEDAFNIASSIEALSTLESAGSYYPFYLNRVNSPVIYDDWQIFKIQEEYAKIIRDSSAWKISTINMNQEICKSYPSYVIIPETASDEVIRKSAKFRRDGRFPTLCYLHNKVPLLRSAEPLLGPNNKRCKDDEKLLSYALSGHTNKGVIIDTRSSAVAGAHRSKGGGFETDHHYPQWRRTFQNIERPPFLGDCIRSLFEACCDVKSGSWLTKLDASGWMNNVEDVMTATLKTVGYLHIEKAPSLVHGYAGTDCTLQVTSLAQLLLCPENRTIKGFESLITREWLWAGHPFTERHLKLGISPGRRKEHAPVFLMFLDCVHQVMRQYPLSFEFTDNLLLLIAQHSYSSEFGTFLFNSEWQRKQSKVSERTVSFWSYLNREDILSTIKNPIYEMNLNVLWPSVSPQSLSLWFSLFAKSTLSSGPDANEEIMEIIMQSKNENDMLKTKAKQLKQEYERLRSEILEQNTES